MSGKGMAPRRGYNQAKYVQNYDYVFRPGAIAALLGGPRKSAVPKQTKRGQARPIAKARTVRKGRKR